MDRSEYWFLDAVWRWPLPLDFLIRQEVLELDLNKEWHGLASSEVIDRLHHLFMRGDIIGRQKMSGESSGDFMPTRDQIKTGFLEGQDISDFEVIKQRFGYKLTPQGGARWETVSNVDWSRYVAVGGHVEPHANQVVPDYREAISINRDLVETVVQWFAASSPKILGTEEWGVTAPWKPTYWKVFHQAHRVVFRTDPLAPYPQELLQYQWYEQRY